MASTTFAYGTLITSVWLNDVNAAVYNTLPTLAPLISPHFTTPNLDVASAISINKNVFSTPAATCTWTLASGKTFAVNNSVTINGTDGSTLTFSGNTSLTGTSSGTNTGDQNIFKTIAVTGQTSIVAGSPTDTLTLTAGTNIGLTTSGNAVTISSSAAVPATVFLGSATVSSAVTNIDFLSLFSASYDHYIIDIAGVTPTASNTDQLYLRFANGGTLDTGTSYTTPAAHGAAISASTNQIVLTSAAAVSGSLAQSVNLTVQLRNTNDTSNLHSKGVGVYGCFNTTAVAAEAKYNNSASLSGFRLFWSAGTTFATGTVRVYGIKTS